MLRLVEQRLEAVERLGELVGQGAVVEQAGEQPLAVLDLEGDPLQALRGADQRPLSRRPSGVSLVSWPRIPSPRSMRPRMVLSEWVITTTLSITSSPEAIRASTLVGCAARISPSSGIGG